MRQPLAHPPTHRRTDAPTHRRIDARVAATGARLATGWAGSPFAGRGLHPLDDVPNFVGLRADELLLLPHPAVHVRGKGRRERMLPLWRTTAVALRAWLAVRGTAPCPELFLNARGGPLSRDGFEYILAKHLAKAIAKMPSIGKKRVSPHVLRHTCAMHTLEATHDIRKVALWLGHASVQTTEIYVRADPTEKLEAIESVLPPALRRGRFLAPDKLLASLRSPRNRP